MRCDCVLSGAAYDPQAITAAVAVGAHDVVAAGALSGILPWEETLERVRSGWARHELELVAPGWHFNEQNHLWVGTGGR